MAPLEEDLVSLRREGSFKIKAQGLLNAGEWVMAAHGREALRDVLQGCSQSVRDRYTSALAMEWHPAQEFIEFLVAAEKRLGSGMDGRICEDIGAAGAHANLKSILIRLAVYVAQPHAVMKRAGALWHQFNSEGSMDVHRFEDGFIAYEVKGIKAPDRFFCATITGWGRVMGGEAMKKSSTVARHTECRALGGSRCLYEVRWRKGDGQPPPRP